ncbi:MAG: DUF3078 domain-containing protein [Bacteroides sp.]|nr:DUF3078 domain-containing protein [Bacteroides sp.]
MSRFKVLLIAAIAAVAAISAHSQVITGIGAQRAIDADTVVFLPWFDEELVSDVCILDSTIVINDSITIRHVRPVTSLPLAEYREPIFDTWRYLDTLTLIPEKRNPIVAQAFEWIDDTNFARLLLDRARQNYMANNPDLIAYNAAWLPEQPDQLNATVDPTQTRISLREQIVGDRRQEVVGEILDVEPTRWIHNFNASVQFSQAYVSPNWYQGGNNSLIMLVNAVYNVKLNQKFYPKYLFDTTISYKLGTNSAPDDTVRTFNISEDLFQINSTFGYKAMRRWYYSVNLQFKTQLLNTYQSNSTQIKSGFLSPGDLNVGIGMTYNYQNPKKTLNFDASIDPLSWRLRTCINNDIDETAYEIKPGRNMVSQYGSSAECKLSWKIAYNIIYTSRLYTFSDYSNFHGDWENTVSFNINRYLTTQIYAHLRYDTSTPRCDDPSWHKLQVKEVLSFGLTYRFSNI